MGTRGTIRIRKNGKQIIMYNHYDSYPSGLGVKFLKDIQTMIEKYGLDGFLQMIDSVKIVTDADIPTEEDIQKLAEYTDLSVGPKSNLSWYCLLRKLQGDFMKLLEVGYMHMYDIDYEDYLYEDFNYVLDLDLKCVHMAAYSIPDLIPTSYTPLSELDTLIKEWSC